MSVHKYINLQVCDSKKTTQPNFDPLSPAENCDINILVADGWAITGHYRDQTLQSVTLQKTSWQETQ
jgi:hypothetical protein